MSSHASTPRQIVIIGAGIVGLSTAWWLARTIGGNSGASSAMPNGRTRSQTAPSITVLDHANPLDGASSGNAGLLSIGHYPLTRPGASWRGLRWMASRRSPLYIRPTLDPRVLSWLWSFHRHCNRAWSDRCLAALCALGFPALEAFELMIAEENIHCEYARDGWLDVVLSAGALRAAEIEARALEPFGYRVSTLSGAALRQAHPVFRDEVAGAVHYHDSARCHPGLFLRGLLDAVRRRGATVRLDAEIAALEVADGTRGEPQMRGVRLADGSLIEADAVIVAAGAWSEPLVAPLGIRIPMMPARGYHLHYDSVAKMPGTGCVLHERAVAVTPMGESLRLAGTLELGPTGRPWMRERIDAIVEGASTYLHGVHEWRPSSEWAGYRPCTPDGMPIVGSVPGMRGLVIATGHAMMGMTLGPVSGRLASELVLGLPPSADLSLLRADRFGVRSRAGRRGSQRQASGAAHTA